MVNRRIETNREGENKRWRHETGRKKKKESNTGDG